MVFYNRKREQEVIRRILSAPGPSLIIIKGLRRVGKTSLALKALEGKNFVNLFVPKDKTVGLFLEESAAELGIPRFTTLLDFLRYLMEHNECIFMDEFQNFYSLDKSAYSDLQKLFEEAKRANRKLTILVTGSSYSLIKKIFHDYAKALYGRRDIEITLEELPLGSVCTWLKDLRITDMEEQIKYWSVCGGMPKLYEIIGKMSPKSFADFLHAWLQQGRAIIDEGNSILVSEFGGAYKTYYSVLEAIAQGKTKLSEIASIFGNDATMTNRYLDLMRKEYNLIAKMTPVLEDIRTSRQGLYSINYNFLLFWFAFVKRYEGYYEQNRVAELLQQVNENINSFIGRGFERFCLEVLKQSSPFPFSLSRLGRQWGKIPAAPKGENQYEFDICGTNAQTKQILFGECKWQAAVDAESLLAELKTKAQYVNWNKTNRTEYYALFAKSFKKKIQSENLFLFDLKDMESLLARYDEAR